VSENGSAREIQQRMTDIRAGGREQMNAIIENSRELTSWRFYVKQYPWVCLGATAAVGYLLVPRRLELVSPDEKALERLAKKNRLVVESNPQPRPKRGLLSGATSFLASLLIREATTLVRRELGARAAEYSHGSGATGNGRGRSHHGDS
jgi:hypothetical protein